MPLLSANLNIMEKACKKASKLLIRDFGEVEKLQVSKKGPGDFVTNSDKRTEKTANSLHPTLSKLIYSSPNPCIQRLTKRKLNYARNT